MDIYSYDVMETDRPQKRDLERMEPRPPTPIETTTSTADKHFPLYQSADYGKIMAQEGKKGILVSKGIWGAILVIVAFLLQQVGIDVTLAFADAYYEGGLTLMEIVQVAGAILAAVGRAYASKALSWVPWDWFKKDATT